MVNKFYDVMVDIETTGVQPNRTAMIQLAAVRFNLAEQTVDSSDMFNKALFIPNTRFWQESTRDWWTQQKPTILNEIYMKMEEPAVVMQEFSDWALNGGNSEEPLRFWAKPTSFDFSFVQSYLDDYGIYNPFHFRYATDMNSFIRGLANDSSVATFANPDFQGDAHNAIFDVINQIDTVFKAVNHYNAKKID